MPHPDDPHQARDLQPDDRLMLYIATRTIDPGEELTFDYGEDTGF